MGRGWNAGGTRVGRGWNAGGTRVGRGGRTREDAVSL